MIQSFTREFVTEAMTIPAAEAWMESFSSVTSWESERVMASTSVIP
jgi:hypothetical protein